MPDPAGCWFTTSGDLEPKLIDLIVTVLSVVFLGHIVTWDGQGDLLGFGVAIGAVIAGLTFLLHEPRRPHSKTMSKRRPGQRPADHPDSNPGPLPPAPDPGAA